MALILLAIPSSPAMWGHYPRCFGASFLSQCLPHSSHTFQPCLHGKLQTSQGYLCVCVCVCDWNSCRGARGLALTCMGRLISSYVVAVCLFCWDVMEAEGGHTAPECNTLRPHLLSRRVCCVLFWLSIQALICPYRVTDRHQFELDVNSP